MDDFARPSQKAPGSRVARLKCQAEAAPKMTAAAAGDYHPLHACLALCGHQFRGPGSSSPFSQQAHFTTLSLESLNTARFPYTVPETEHDARFAQGQRHERGNNAGEPCRDLHDKAGCYRQGCGRHNQRQQSR